MDKWIEKWDHPALHVICGKGAQDAWLLTSLKAEICKLQGLSLTGGSIDVFKCFDQINRELLFLLAKEAGMPTRILLPYFKYIDNLKVRFQVGEIINAVDGENSVDMFWETLGCRLLGILLPYLWNQHQAKEVLVIWEACMQANELWKPQVRVTLV